MLFFVVEAGSDVAKGPPEWLIFPLFGILLGAMIVSLFVQHVISENSVGVVEDADGVSDVLLDPGTYYINPFKKKIHTVTWNNLRYFKYKNITFSNTRKGRLFIDVRFILDKDKIFYLYNTHRFSYCKKLIDPRLDNVLLKTQARMTLNKFSDPHTYDTFGLDFAKMLKDELEPFGIIVNEVFVERAIH